MLGPGLQDIPVYTHLVANFAICKKDKSHFHSLLTGGNVAGNRKGVAFIIRGPDTDEVLGKGGQRPQDRGCCSARNLDL